MLVRKVVGRTSQLVRMWVVLGAVVLAAILLALLPPTEADAVSTPSGFQESTVFSSLSNPTALQFSKNGRIFVAEKSGLIKVFDNLSDTTPTTFADLRTKVHDFWDRGMLGMVIDPDYPTKPYVYVLYTHDAAIGGTAPRWRDDCPTPPGPTADGCVVSGRLSRLQADPTTNTMIGNEQVLIEDWCQQYPSHSVGSLVFGSDRALYVSGGDGASYNFVDYGQDGSPLNPCGDPPGGVGAALTPPTAEGGALRSQDLRTNGDPVSLNGAILRVDPATGAGLPENPLAASSDPNARRIIAYGLRNPFRITIRPGTTNEVWAGDVGWNEWEEIDRVADPSTPVENFGWPCYEGNNKQAGYDGANLTICEDLYNGRAGAVPDRYTDPYFQYRHSERVVPNESCPIGGSSTAGIAFEFYQGGAYPSDFDGALFFADYSRDCIWVMKKGADNLPAPGLRQTFVGGAANPVDLQVSPAGELYYVDLDGGTIRRIQFNSANQPPRAEATASPTTGNPPLTVNFNGSGSSDPDGDSLSYAWDLDDDGQYDDSTSATSSGTYSSAGSYRVDLRVTDSKGASDTLDQKLVVSVGNTPPVATITAPAAGTTWTVGDTVAFSGSASDAQEQNGSLPASSLSWELIQHHCFSQNDCHTHVIRTFSGVDSGSFNAPDHEYPSYLELKLTATDSGGLTDTKSVRLDPRTVALTFNTSPVQLQLAVNGNAATAPFSRTVIVGSNNSISAITPQQQTTKGRTTTYTFRSWSDGGAQTHNIIAPSSATTYKATFNKR
jgi:glucose/arabinose dehydrogenase